MLAEQEHQQRHQARLRRLLHEAQLPVPKTLAEYDWGAIPDLDRPQIEQLAHDTGWLDRAENLLLFGPSGVGKTHLAAGICRSLIALDRSARFFSATTLVQELQRAKAEFALAKEQLKTQTPPAPDEEARSIASVSRATADEPVDPSVEPEPIGRPIESIPFEGPVGLALGPAPQLPADWPDPRGFVPPPPTAERPPARPQHEPVLSHTRLYHGNDAEFTKRLANYFYFRDDARFGDWQGYLQRSDDFMRFCCHLHVTEMLAARGGGGKTRVVWRWPIGRYDR